MSYTLAHVIGECISEHAREATTSRGHTLEEKHEIYAESWSALNAWIESKLSKRKVSELAFFWLCVRVCVCVCMLCTRAHAFPLHKQHIILKLDLLHNQHTQLTKGS